MIGVFASTLTEHEFERLCNEARRIVADPEFDPPSLLDVARQIKSLRIREARNYWTAEMDALLGTATDDAIGKAIGKPGQTVADRRRALKIQAFERKWTAEEDAMLGTDTCRAIAEQLGRTRDAVKHRMRFLRRKTQIN